MVRLSNIARNVDTMGKSVPDRHRFWRARLRPADQMSQPAFKCAPQYAGIIILCPIKSMTRAGCAKVVSICETVGSSHSGAR